MDAPMEDKDKRKRGGKRGGRRGDGGGGHPDWQEKRPRREPTGPCWFCKYFSDYFYSMVLNELSCP